MPVSSTMSSQARSPSSRRRPATIHASGLNQCTAQSTVDASSTAKSWRRTCASSCASTARAQSSDQPSASGGRTMRGRNVPQVPTVEWPIRRPTVRRTPSSAATASRSASQRASSSGAVRAVARRSPIRPATSQRPTATAPASHTTVAPVAIRRQSDRAGGAGASATAAGDGTATRASTSTARPAGATEARSTCAREEAGTATVHTGIRAPSGSDTRPATTPDRQHEMPQRGRAPAAQISTRQRDAERRQHADRNHRRHHFPSLRADCTSASMRSRSSSVSRPASRPSSAVTALAADPSKKVSTRWRSAALRAVCRATVGR